MCVKTAHGRKGLDYYSIEMQLSGGESYMKNKVSSGYVCFRETVVLVEPQNITEKYQSEILLGPSKHSGYKQQQKHQLSSIHCDRNVLIQKKWNPSCMGIKPQPTPPIEKEKRAPLRLLGRSNLSTHSPWFVCWGRGPG